MSICNNYFPTITSASPCGIPIFCGTHMFQDFEALESLTLQIFKWHMNANYTPGVK
jgi:hypothetical protein